MRIQNPWKDSAANGLALIKVLCQRRNCAASLRDTFGFSHGVRSLVSRLPYRAKYSISQMIAVCVYFPLARLSRLAERFGLPVASFPLSAYRNLGFYTMRTDSLERFATRLETRFTAQQNRTMTITTGCY